MPPSNSRNGPPETMTICGLTYPIPRNELELLQFVVAQVLKTERESRIVRERLAAIEDNLSKLTSQVKDGGASEDADLHRDSGIALNDEFVTAQTASSLNQNDRNRTFAAADNSASSSTSTLASTSRTGAPVLNVTIPKTGSLSDSLSPSPATAESSAAVKALSTHKVSTLFTAEDQAAFPAGPISFPGFTMPVLMRPEEAHEEQKKLMKGMATEKEREKVLRDTPASAWISMAEMEAIIKRGIVKSESVQTAAGEGVGSAQEPTGKKAAKKFGKKFGKKSGKESGQN